MLTLLAFHHWNMSNLCLTGLDLMQFLVYFLSCCLTFWNGHWNHQPICIALHLCLLDYLENSTYHESAHLCCLSVIDMSICLMQQAARDDNVFEITHQQWCPCDSKSNVRDVLVYHKVMFGMSMCLTQQCRGRSSASQSNIRDVLPHKAMPGMYMSLKKNKVMGVHVPHKAIPGMSVCLTMQCQGYPCPSQSNANNVHVLHKAMLGMSMCLTMQCQVCPCIWHNKPAMPLLSMYLAQQCQCCPCTLHSNAHAPEMASQQLQCWQAFPWKFDEVKISDLSMTTATQDNLTGGVHRKLSLRDPTLIELWIFRWDWYWY